MVIDSSIYEKVKLREDFDILDEGKNFIVSRLLEEKIRYQ